MPFLYRPVARLLAVFALLTAAAGVAGAQISVTPDGGLEPNRTIHSGPHTAVFNVSRASGSGFGTLISFTCTTASVVLSCTPPGSISLAPGANQNVNVTYMVGNEGSGTVTLKATSLAGNDEGYMTVPVVVPAGAPRMSVLPYLEAKQDYGRCAAGCFAMAYAQSTVPYFSLDAPRSVTLVYHGDRLAPKPFVLVDVRPDSGFGGGFPTEYQLQVKIAGSLVTFLNGGAGQTTVYFTNPASKTYRIGGQFAPSGLSRDSTYQMEILVSSKIGGSLYTNRWITTYHHIDEDASPIARGWTVAGVQRAVITVGKGILVKEGDGSATYFRYNGGTAKYEAPDGDFSTMQASGSNWIRAYPDSTKVTFASTGRMSSVADRFGNATSITYDGSNRIWKITDPASKVITLNYGANGLSSIVDPASRTTTVDVAAGTRVLTWIQDPDNLKTQFGYDVSQRLQTITDRRGKARTVHYDSQSGLVVADSLPSIPIYPSGNQRPGTVFDPWQKKGVPYVATATGAGAAPALPDTVWARITEPGGAVTRFTVNRWGSASRSFDAVGDSTVITYTTAGLPARVVRPG